MTVWLTFDHIWGGLTWKLTIIVNLLFQKWYQIRGEYSCCSKLLSARSRFIIVLDQVKHWIEIFLSRFSYQPLSSKNPEIQRFRALDIAHRAGNPWIYMGQSKPAFAVFIGLIDTIFYVTKFACYCWKKKSFMNPVENHLVPENNPNINEVWK